MQRETNLTGYASIDKPWLKYYSEEALKVKLPECTIYEYILEKNINNHNKTAINYLGKKISYGNMFDNIERVAKAFSALGVKDGDLVSMCMITMPETVYSIYALNKLGAISNLIEPRTNADLIKDRINAAKSKILVVVDVFLPKIMKIADKTTLERIIVVPVSASMPMLTTAVFKLTKGRKLMKAPSIDMYQTWNKFLRAGHGATVTAKKYAKNYPAAIIYTGGTTGVSKGALLSNDCFTAMAAEAYYDAPTLFTGKRFLEIMPPFIAYGLIFGHFIPFCAGLENCLIPVFVPEKFGDYVLKYKPNHVIGVPTFFESLANNKKIRKKRLDFLTSCITGGDKMLVATERHINTIYKDRGCKNAIMKGYGMTEMGSAATFTVSDACNIEGSVGIPSQYNIVKVIDPGTGKELKYNEQGELCITGPTMMLGYYNNDRETANVMRKHDDGLTWIHTGDIGYITEDGIIFIVDRIKRMIIRPDGHNVWPSLIENVIAKHPAVSDCAVVGLPNNEYENGKIPTAFIVLKDGFKPSDEIIAEIDALSKKHLPERDVAMAYRFCDELPLTLLGKVDYRALEKRHSKEVKNR